MAIIDVQEKRNLSDLLAKGHRKFGKVAARRPYREDDEGGSGGAELLFEGHPLFADMPLGAASDLTFIITQNNCSLEEAEKRSDEAAPQLRKQLANVLGKSKTHVAAPNPIGK